MPDFEEQAALIERLLAEANLTPDEMAARVIINPETMRKIRKGYQPASKRLLNAMRREARKAQIPSTIQEEAALYKVEQSAAKAAALEPGKKVRQVPIVGWAQAGNIVDFDEVVDWEDSLTIEINDPKAVAVRIRGDSMSPRYPEGFIAVLVRSEHPQNDQLVVARIRDEGVVFKKLQIMDREKGLLRLISFNPQYAPIERREDQFVWIFPVRRMIEDV